MLLVTAFFNFILSKKEKTEPPKRPQDNYRDPVPMCVTERGDTEHPFSLLHMVTGRRRPGLAFVARDSGLALGERGESTQAMLEMEQQTEGSAERERERRKGKEKRQVRFRISEAPEETEMEEMEENGDPETSSDTAPMITD